MPKEFKFRLVTHSSTDERSLIELMEANNIPNTRLKHEEWIGRSGEYRIIIELAIALTPLALERIWNWYKGRRKRKGSQLSVVYNGNLLDLDAKNMKILMSALKEASKVKRRRKRGEQRFA